MSNRSGDILIGRQADGTKVYVEARFEHPHRDLWVETVDHQSTTDRLRLALTGVTVSKYGSISRDGTWLGCGQIVDDLLELTELELGWTVAEVMKLHQIWKEWHLNDLQAGCVHQHNGSNSAPCPITGYKWGHEWLHKPLKFDVFSFISDHFDITPPAPGSAPTV